MRVASLGALMLGLAVAGLGLAQPLPKPAVPNTPTPVERFITWLKTPPKAAMTRQQREAEEKKVELPAAPAPGESQTPESPPVTSTNDTKAAATETAPASSSTTVATAASPGPAPAQPNPTTATPNRRSGLLGRHSPSAPAAAPADGPFEIPAPPTPAVAGSSTILVGLSAVPTPGSLAAQAPALPPPPRPDVELAPQPAQLPPPTAVQPELPQVTATPVMPLEPTLGFNDAVFVYDSPGSYWTSVEYLMWRTQHAPLGYPMVTASLTTGSSTTGAVNSAGVVTFFDKGNMSYPWYSGVRATAGMWLDSAERWGVEASGFFVNTPGIHFASIASTKQPSLSGPAGPQGTIAIYMPFINSVSGAATAQVIGAQAFSTGFIDIDSTSNLNGAEVNLVRNVYRGPDCYVELLTGYRYVDLKESLSLTADTNATGTTTKLTSPNQFLINDSFATRSQFNGAQMGGRVTWRRDCFRCTVSGKLALGVTQESGSILGATTFFSSSLPPVTTTGGFYAQPSNIGSFTRSQFAAVPQLGINLGYQAGKHCFFYFGYDMLYWTRVVRPGDMVSPLLNPASITSNPSFTGAASTNPPPLFLSRDFWAQGVDMGLEVKY
jgi:hypothetical protein